MQLEFVANSDLSEISARFSRQLQGDVGLVSNFVNEVELEYRKMLRLARSTSITLVSGSPLAAYCSAAEELTGVACEEADELPTELTNAYRLDFGNLPPYAWLAVDSGDFLSANPDPGGV